MRLLRQRPSGSARPHYLAALDADNPPVRSLYAHVPFCFHKCHYCDFYSIVDTRDRQRPFVDRIARELAALAPLAAGAGLETVFVGGGTPTLLEPALWKSLAASLHGCFLIDDSTEFTVECNPETVSDDITRALADAGVNRASVGAQSFDPDHLKTLERWHDPGSVARAIERLRAAGVDRLSIDLIYAIPGQTLGDLDRDLDVALSLQTEIGRASCRERV
jgi:oxygen-independent coproporphyrinogen III oxidase